MSFENSSKQPKSRRILVIDDDKDSLEILLEPLRWEGYDARGVTTEKEAHNLIETWIPQVVILDWMAPSMAGLRVLKTIRERLNHVSCVFVSENSSTEAIIEALDSGADDYIVKPFVPLELLARIRTQLRIRDLHEQLLYANEKLKELVDTDDLTGLYNMRSLYQRLDFEMERGRRFHRDVCVVMMDMDYFKTVNDGHDHLFGSYVLSEVGKIIRANTRNIDIPARYGGDEFLVVLTETNHEGAMYFCERLRENIQKTTFRNGEDSIKLTASVGFAITIPGENISARELVRRADHALYDAKRGGRNMVCYYKPEQAPVVELKSAAQKRRKAAG
ncbi:diguanylate cyclase response regulator [Bdellovibrio bacteriovorus]|uniref:diguanylate cyclase n=1 Tax=Bdellovibrio bacteriovorus TaxID=959 RepID=A0A162GYY9_BDEBC|nr:diguanylate cyclase [Bdellovibrio bacteriovorus]KYG69267.1 diguanylate cyclase response regulator [Bdellovibrio bacteriovorus]